jgi:tagatose 6-phosphate kinase
VILCICPSPAIDVTYHVAALHRGGSTRVRSLTRRAGGKAVNVACVLHAVGVDSHVLAPVGGPAGAEFAELLQATGVPADLVRDPAPTRTTVTIVDATGEASVLLEPAATRDWPALLTRAEALLPAAEVVVVSGSMPEGAPPDALAAVLALARAAGRPVVVDTSGPALLQALAAGATLVKPNAAELAQVVPQQPDPVLAARTLATEYRSTVVASLGSDGAVLAGPDGVWHARPGATLTGNPTGAGDALVAGLARGLAAGHAAHELLAESVALSAAAVLHPFAGRLDPAEYARQRAAVTVRALQEQS